MPAQLIDGKKVAQKINDRTQRIIAELDLKPGLGVILVGNDPASKLYVNLKKKACAKAGLNFYLRELPPDATQEQVLKAVQEMNQDPKVHAMIVQLPLPAHLRTNEIIAAMKPEKDADGFHPKNRNRNDVPPVLPAATLELLWETGTDLAGKNVATISRGDVLFGQMARILRSAGMHCDHISVDEPKKATEYDIVIVAVGEPRFLKGEHVKPESTVIDIGTTRIDGRTVGDVDFASVKEVAGWLTPVPGGVGPVTVAMLINNVAKLATRL